MVVTWALRVSCTDTEVEEPGGRIGFIEGRGTCAEHRGARIERPMSICEVTLGLRSAVSICIAVGDAGRITPAALAP